MSLESEIRRIAKHEGFQGITDFLTCYHSIGYCIPDIQVHVAAIYNIHYSNSHYFNTLNPYFSKARERVRVRCWQEKWKARRYGFKSIRSMRLWFRKAQELGWNSPRAAVSGLKREGLTNSQIGKYFGVTGSAIKKRSKKWTL